MIRHDIHEFTPYVPGQSIESIQAQYNLDHIIKLASNENPLGAAVNLHDLTIQSALYPDDAIHPLLPALATHLGVSKDHLILGNGSDEILQLVALATIQPGDTIISSECTFSEYRFVAQLTRANYIAVPMINHTYHIDGIIDAITPNTRLIFIANPNNPTGTYVSHHAIDTLLRHIPSTTLLVLDEAYAEYVTASDYPRSISLLNHHPNLLITRTFSKIYGLAGFRIGYGIGNPSIVSALKTVKQPFNVNSLALSAAYYALQATDFVEQSKDVNRRGMAFLRHELRHVASAIPDSQGNFLYVELGHHDGVALCQRLLEKGIIVRSMRSFGYPNAIRVTVGTQDQNTAFLTALFACIKP